MVVNKRKLVFWILGLILAPVLLVFLLGVALYIPAIQRWSVSIIEQKASNALNKSVHIGQLRLTYPLNLSLGDVSVLNAPRDTMMSVDRLELGLSPMALLDNLAVVPSLGLEGVQYNQVDTLKQTTIHFRLKQGELKQAVLAWKKEKVSASSLVADGLMVYYHSSDTTKSESEPLRWTIDLANACLKNSSLDIGLPLDSLLTQATIPYLATTNLGIDLGKQTYRLRSGKLKDASLVYHKGGETKLLSGLINPNHIELKHTSFDLEQVLSQGSDLELSLRGFTTEERSGLKVKQLSLICQMDSLNLKLADLSLRTDYSALKGHIKVPFSMFKGDSTVFAELGLDADLSLKDALTLSGEALAPEYRATISNPKTSGWIVDRPIHLAVDLEGTLQELAVKEANLKWKDILNLSCDGTLYNLQNYSRRRGRITLEGQTSSYTDRLLSLFVSGPRAYRIPENLALTGKVDLMKGHLLTDLQLRHQAELVKLYANLDEQTKSYKAKLHLEQFNGRTYMPSMGVGLVTAHIEAEGRGYDLFSQATSSVVKGRIDQMQYEALALKDVTFDGRLRRGELNLNMNSFNPGLDFSLLLEAVVNRNRLQSSIIMNANDIDASALGISPLLSALKLSLKGELSSDFKDNHSFRASAEGMQFAFDGELIKPNQVDLSLNTNTKQSALALSSGDLKLSLSLGEAPTKLMGRANELTLLGKKWWSDVQTSKSTQLKLEQLVAKFPELDLDVEMGTNNALRAYLIKSRLSLEGLEGQVRLRPNFGIDGHILARDLRQDTLRINCVDLTMNTLHYPRKSKGSLGLDSLRFVTQLKIDKTRFRQQKPFTLNLSLNNSLQDAVVTLVHKGEHGKVENQMKVLADWTQSSYRLHIPDTVLVLAGNTLHVNDGNWFNLTKGNYFFSGNLNLTNPQNNANLSFIADHREYKEQEALLSVKGIALQDYRALGLPNLSGTLSGDIDYAREGDIHKQPVISGDLAIQELSYEDKKLGHFAMALFYQPRTDGTHDLTTEISYKGKQALSINGIYDAKSKDPLKATLKLKEFPMEIANPFTSSYHTYLAGSVSGDLQMSGSLSDPQLLGSLKTQAGKIDLQDYATTLLLDSLPLQVNKDRIEFDNYALHSSVDLVHPLLLNGYIHTHGSSMMNANLSITANEVKLMEQMRPKKEGQVVYGRLISSGDIRVNGSLMSPRVRGRLDVLSGTSCTYVMKESVLDNSDKSVGLVEFKDFADTLFLDKAPVSTRDLGGMDMNLSIHIDPTVRFNVNLTPDGRDYMNMQGGGNLQFRYRPYGEMSLIGRYDMSGGGTLQYTLPVVGSKHFAIDPSGYIAFDGDVINPTIDFMATQKVRASVGDATNGKTNFNVSIKAKNRIDNINLGFDLSAPENLSIQNRLVAMSSEERAKQAIGLLATGTFLGGSGANNLDLNETFSALIQNQINTVAGSLLSGTDLSVGMNLNENGLSGVNRASYTYSFSRRFYNDRIRVVVGGKIQTGENATNSGQQFIDNVSVEYQMDKAGERFAQVYHKRITDNVIEGEYSETGVGLLLRRKLSKLSDFFRFKRKRKPLPTDSTKSKSKPSHLFMLPPQKSEEGEQN